MTKIIYFPRTIVSSNTLTFVTPNGEVFLNKEVPTEVTQEQLSSLNENEEFKECLKQSIIIVDAGVDKPPEDEPPASAKKSHLKV